MLKVLKYLDGKQRLSVALCLTLIIVQVWLDLKLPDYMSAITTLVETEGSSMSDILAQGSGMLFCALGSMASSFAVGYFAARVAAGLARTLRGLVFDQVIELSKGDVEHFSTSSLINRTTNDITQIQTLVAMGLQAIIKAPILAVWAVCKIAGKGWEWSTATAVAVFVVIIMLAATLIFAVPRFRRVQGITDKINRLTREHLSGIRPVHAYNAEQWEQKRFAGANDEITDVNLVANRVMAIMNPGMTFVTSMLTMVVYWIGAYLIQASEISLRLSVFSDMVVFSNYAIQVILAFILLNMVFILLPRAQVAAGRVCEVIDAQSSVRDGAGADVTPSNRGRIEFRDVSFSYPDGGEVLSHISFSAEPGQTVALIGTTGSGKTTLVQLVDRLYDATSGCVLVDGVDVKDFALDDLHDRIGYVPQTATLFSGTVASNVAYGESGAPIEDAEVSEALDVAQASDFVAEMDGGADALIEQGGRNVSGGQRQRIAIARAIARKPEILVFDDSFSALDFSTDKALREALEHTCHDVTRLMVAQRIGTIRNADHIVVLDHGIVAGQGTHDELIASCTTYREIAGSQMSKEELEHV